MLSYKTKRKFRKILSFGIIWTLLGWLFLFIEQTAIIDAKASQQEAIEVTPKIFLFASLSVFLVGMFVGYLELTFLNKLFINKPFYKKVLFKLFFYLILFSLIMLVLYPIASSIQLGMPLFSATIWQRYIDFLSSTVHVSTLVQLSASLFISLIYTEISDNLGHGVLQNFIIGKYHKPKEEHRIFLFTDMKDSTAIAEKLGTKKYFSFLRDYYDCLEDPIIKFGGDVYQYIGDEIVITWEYKTGIKKNNCLHTFFEMKHALEKNAEFFLETYGYIPSFKGGMHYGVVTTGEIGALKKEIVFSGDILNTTARIQGACSTYNTDLLLSQALAKRLDFDKGFDFSEIGEVSLKGKNESLTLVKVHKINPK
ncbi:adenylate/guanylate cyclase domain-containing protein [Maribacter cobaltidurans]|uniref:Uncharacterized protein n=1 Tax=Maribacter cobaltidurans TaxID=1178778 RepID=A0A223V7Z6_9FLAO|nr:adenylate/guanylate cyclase domain-containing protein [Maribacter cobaltidurans]ASV30999.1 hypothetical protein CJ263_12660 [Maribacter cobaltidurans]GGD90393.1 hypothetical protein GCM10011412_30440 [Maribacter cobaltidurans]